MAINRINKRLCKDFDKKREEKSMKTINIYITHTMKPGMEREGEVRYDIVLNQAGKESNSVGATKKVQGTMHAAILQAIVEAVDRVNEPVYMNIYMNDTFISNMFYGQMDTWIREGWNRELKCMDEWKKLAEIREKHVVNMIYAIRHSMTTWQENQIKNDMDNISQGMS